MIPARIDKFYSFEFKGLGYFKLAKSSVCHHDKYIIFLLRKGFILIFEFGFLF